MKRLAPRPAIPAGQRRRRPTRRRRMSGRATGRALESPPQAALECPPVGLLHTGTRSMSTQGQLVSEIFDFDGGRQVTAWLPAAPPRAVVYAGDGQLIPHWGDFALAAGAPPTLIVGVHRLDDETRRLHEYTPFFASPRFDAHAAFLTGDVRAWTRSRFDVDLPAERTAVFGVSAGGELALALGLAHPDVFGALFCASSGGGYRPPSPMPAALPRAYLAAGTEEPFFRDNAARWADAFKAAGADVVMTERPGTHGGPFWRAEFPLMLRWAFGD